MKVHINMYTHIYIYIHVHIHTHICIYINKYINICIYSYTQINIYTYIYIYIYTYICIYMYLLAFWTVYRSYVCAHVGSTVPNQKVVPSTHTHTHISEPHGSTHALANEKHSTSDVS